MVQLVRISLLLGFAATVPAADAHYLWIVVQGKANGEAAANLFFEHGPKAGDGKYLEPFIKRGKMWLTQVGSSSPASLKLVEVNKPKQKNRWLTAKLTAKGPRSVDCYCKWGTYRYGNKYALLHYYGRHIEAKSAKSLALLPDSPLGFRIVPTTQDEELHLRVDWKGKPAANVKVTVGGPGLLKTLTTNADGKAHFKPAKAGQYRLRAYKEEQKSGEFEGREYQQIRHHSTLILALPLAN